MFSLIREYEADLSIKVLINFFNLRGVSLWKLNFIDLCIRRLIVRKFQKVLLRMSYRNNRIHVSVKLQVWSLPARCPAKIWQNWRKIWPKNWFFWPLHRNLNNPKSAISTDSSQGSKFFSVSVFTSLIYSIKLSIKNLNNALWVFQRASRFKYEFFDSSKVPIRADFFDLGWSSNSFFSKTKTFVFFQKGLSRKSYVWGGRSNPEKNIIQTLCQSSDSLMFQNSLLNLNLPEIETHFLRKKKPNFFHQSPNWKKMTCLRVFNWKTKPFYSLRWNANSPIFLWNFDFDIPRCSSSCFSVPHVSP